MFCGGRLDTGQALCASRTGRIKQGTSDALPLPGFKLADRCIEIGQQLADMALDIPFDPIRSDLVPVGALDLDDDQHLLAIIGDDCEVNSPSAARQEPPSAFPESCRMRQIGQERGLNCGMKCPPFREPLNRHVLVLVALAAPLIHVAFTGADASALPASSSAGTAYKLVQSSFTAFSEAPAGIVVDTAHATPRDLASLATEAAAVPGIKAVSTFEHLGGSLWESNVALASAPLSPAAQRTVNALQSLHGPGPVTVVGQTASFQALQISLKSHLPLVLGLIILIALVMLFAMTRSAVLPLMAVMMNGLTIGATFGMLVWVFQWGHLSHLLGFSGPGALQSTSLLIILAVVFGLSTDYGVFLLGRMKEEHDAGATPYEAVALGLDRTGGIVSAAAVCLALAMGALVLSRLVFVKELGLGVAFAVLLDATVVRAVLVPAVMRLLGPVAWWSPWSTRQTERPVIAPARFERTLS